MSTHLTEADSAELPAFLRGFNAVGPARTKERLAGEIFDILMATGLPGCVHAHHEMLRDFVNELGRRHRDNPFHNWAYACEMVRCAAWFVQQPGIASRIAETDRFWLLIATTGYAADHPGFDSMWGSVFAQARAEGTAASPVSERFALPVLREVMAMAGCDFAHSMSGKAQIRGSVVLGKLMRTSGLLPDEEFTVRFAGSVSLQQHLQHVSQPFLSMLLMEAIFKAASIYGLVLPYEASRQWGKNMMEEFWVYGRRMKTAGFKVGPIVDETRMRFEDVMVRLIQDLGLALFGTLAKVEPAVTPLVDSLRQNLAHYRRSLPPRI